MSGTAEALHWRVVVDGPGSGARNMALDHALAECLEEGTGVLRLYSWEAPTVSFGRNEPARTRYDRGVPAARTLGFVRRPTGGRAVLHDREVTYAVVAPLRAFGGLRDAYRTINDGLVAGLTALGVPAVASTDGIVAPVDAGPCFRHPAPGEVVAGGRKLVGSAQARVAGALLQHGSVILDGDQAPLAAMAPDGDAWEPPATVTALVDPAPSVPAVVEALHHGCRLAWGGTWAESEYASLELVTADRLEESRYARGDWTWRR